MTHQKKINLLVLSHTSDLFGGAERSMLDVFDNLTSKYNVKPEFILREPLGSLVGAMRKRKWKYYPLKYTFWSYTKPPQGPEAIAHNALQNAKAVEAIAAIITATKPDLVITNSIICPWGAMAAYSQKIPHIWFVREYGDLDHGRTFDIPHEQIFEDVGNLSDLVVANSETMAAHITKLVDAAKVTTLYNPFDLGAIAKRASRMAASPYRYKDSLKLVIIGNLARTKGQLEAIEACGLLNQAGHLTELCVVGRRDDPVYQNEIEATIKKYRISNKVHLMGLQENALAFVLLADAGITASRLEAFGRSTFEYLALGKPVVGANSGATPEMVKNSTNGYLYEPQNAKDLARAVKHYFDDKSLIAKHGAASKAKAEAMMRGEHNLDALYKKIEKVAEGKSEPKSGPINYLPYWQKLQDSARSYKGKPRESSLPQIIRFKLHQKVKAVYYFLRGIKARTTGK